MSRPASCVSEFLYELKESIHLWEAIQALQVWNTGHKALNGLHHKVLWLVDEGTPHCLPLPLSDVSQICKFPEQSPSSR